MKYYVHQLSGEKFAFSADGSQDYLITSEMREMTESEVFDHLNPPLEPEVREQIWVLGELDLVAGQLLRIEDEDPTALPGTDRQWRDYRIQLRAWAEGADGFPDVVQRPTRPDF